jgi:hypothetical protein
MMKDKRVIPILISILPTILVSVSLAYGANSQLFNKDSNPYGVSYGDWLAKWWQWNFNISPSEHPRDHYSPQRCSINQTGPVWFLPDILKGREERSCNVPEGVAVLVPLLTGFCDDDNTDPLLKTDEGLRKCAMEGNEYGIVTASLDGQSLQNLDQYRTQTSFFNLTVPKDNWCNCVPGTWKTMADGFFVFLKPLQFGKHDLILKTNVVNPTSPSYNYVAEAVYHLTVGH